MFANMASSLIIHDRIETTLPKAKELRRVADKMVTLAKKGTVSARRRAIQIIRNKKAVSRAFDELAGRFQDRAGGYTRIMKLGNRHGDSAPMAIIEYLPSEHGIPSTPPKTKKVKAKKKEAKEEEKKAEKKSEKKAKPAKKAAAKKAKPAKAAKAKAPAKKRSGRKVSKEK
jgi:large subunit ribosomal protein L17